MSKFLLLGWVSSIHEDWDTTRQERLSGSFLGILRPPLVPYRTYNFSTETTQGGQRIQNKEAPFSQIIIYPEFPKGRKRMESKEVGVGWQLASGK